MDLDEITAKVKRDYDVFDARRKLLAARYEKAKTTGKRLKALAALMKQHGEYCNRGILAGWQQAAVIQFAEHAATLAEHVLDEEAEADASEAIYKVMEAGRERQFKAFTEAAAKVGFAVEYRYFGGFDKDPVLVLEPKSET